VITFFVPGPPQGKGRARIGKIAGHARMFTPSKTVAYEGLIALAAELAADMAGLGGPLDGPVVLEVDIVQTMPESWSKAKRAASLVPIGKPDVDNVVKAVGDGCNGILWHDDKQIAKVVACRRWGPKPELQVRVRPWTVSEAA
jgi:Holliday junction resolvase RusA-like endonuclease